MVTERTKQENRAGAVVLCAAAAFAILSGCKPADTGAGPEQKPAPKYSESPILRERVERGELPPVEERLPDEPMVVTPRDGTGRYDSDPD